ncbi:hypothetical protein MNBD_GAMMA12-2381 [hydrothermal vent metagenome]|uniref:Rhs element Vgr protein n=1 Tax=hydrothermal vent metagenome TaxID=652676 RepID=A0A3B0Y5A8_9ZZZZ
MVNKQIVHEFKDTNNIEGAAENESPMMNCIARVAEVSNHQALLIEFSGVENTAERYIEITAHLNNVPPLKVGDQVLVTATEQDYIVTGRLRTEEESPLDGLTYSDGKLNLLAGKAIKIQTGDAVIELTATGKIKIDGKNIYSLSEGRHRLQGSTIELN